MTSEPPLFVASFLCPLLAVCCYERTRLKPLGRPGSAAAPAGSAPIFWGAGRGWAELPALGSTADHDIGHCAPN